MICRPAASSRIGQYGFDKASRGGFHPGVPGGADDPGTTDHFQRSEMNPLTDEAAPVRAELEALLRLLDDETPEVRRSVAARLARCGGDISEWLATREIPLTRDERVLLSRMLSPSRRGTLALEWVAPSGGAAAMGEDWEGFEAMLRLLSDFLHDGISIRQPLSDALDLLAEEAAEHDVFSEDDLRVFLFEEARYVGNQLEGDDPCNFDLAWSLEAGRSNSLGLGLIFLLVARRIGLEVEGVDFPEHFLCRIFEDGQPLIVDCFDHGKLHLQSALMENPELGRKEKAVLRRTADPGTLMLRLLNDLESELEEADRGEDAGLIRRLRGSLEPG